MKLPSKCGATLSKDRRYRYALWRQWNTLAPTPVVAFIGLNPSTADERTDDPTIRRCRGFAEDWGFRSMIVLNLFALRSTDPAALRRSQQPVGEENNKILKHWCDRCRLVVCCWGNPGSYLSRYLDAMRFLAGACNPVCFGLTKQRQPLHPLYLKRSAQRFYLDIDWGSCRLELGPAYPAHVDDVPLPAGRLFA